MATRLIALAAAAVLGAAAAAWWCGVVPASRGKPSPEPRSLAEPPSATEALPASTSMPMIPVSPAGGAAEDEPTLMARLRSIKDLDARSATLLADEGNERFPDSPDAPERATIRIHALAAQGLLTEARRSAEEMVNHYPDSHWVRDVELFTGAHRHRSVRVNDSGDVEYH